MTLGHLSKNAFFLKVDLYTGVTFVSLLTIGDVNLYHESNEASLNNE